MLDEYVKLFDFLCETACGKSILMTNSGESKHTELALCEGLEKKTGKVVPLVVCLAEMPGGTTGGLPLAVMLPSGARENYLPPNPDGGFIGDDGSPPSEFTISRDLFSRMSRAIEIRAGDVKDALSSGGPISPMVLGEADRLSEIRNTEEYWDILKRMVGVPPPAPGDYPSHKAPDPPSYGSGEHEEGGM